jgi:hypothetical protein
MLVLAVAAIAVLAAVSPLRASVEKVDEGILFTYYDPDAGQVFLAGSFNGWNTTATPMTRDENGYWTAVLQLAAGEHEYKLVVDGAWITDTENPNTKADPYGGMNSLVEIDAEGEIVERAAATPISNTKLSSRVFIGGRYLSRALVEKDAVSYAPDGSELNDTRWRAQRPAQNVDLNFRITISELVHGYTRLRIDSEENVLQPNNISVFLDEGHIEVNPASFTVTGYYNEERLDSGDPLGFFGDIDLPGTIPDDHLPFGKGTAGVTGTSNIRGFGIEGFMANVHDFDFNNDPRLFDNTGTDLVNARTTKDYRNITFGANFFMERNLWWLDFTSLVGEETANTGITRMDEYLNRTGDDSDWFEFEDRMYMYGPDITIHLMDGRLLPQLELLWGTYEQGFVTGNNSGLNQENGPIDVPIFERDVRVAHGSVRSTLLENVTVNAEHSRIVQNHPNAAESYLSTNFRYDADANKQIFFGIDAEPETYTTDYSELTLDYNRSRYGATLWLQRWMNKSRLPYSDSEYWYNIVSAAPALRYKPKSGIELEVEHQFTKFEGKQSMYSDLTSFETIARGTVGITKTLSAILDVRNIYIKNDTGGESKSFTAPFAGILYKPTKKVSLVFAYGLDPIDYDIDYEGRQTGRHDFREDYIWALPDTIKQEHYGGLHPIMPFYLCQKWDPTLSIPVLRAGETLDGNPLIMAEEALDDRKIFTLRVIYNF